MLLSPCVWAIIITHALSVFGYFTIVNQLPNYFKNILHFDIKKVRFWATFISIPQIPFLQGSIINKI